jgi:hypothetical protein
MAERTFTPIKEGATPERNLGRLGRYYSGSVNWTTLRQHRRVVVLAEASAGKTWEFQSQAALEGDDGRVGFFVRIDTLADSPLEDVLDAEAIERLDQWRRGGNGDAWFFLDSVDEARLNRKSFEDALRRLGKGLGAALSRARIIISCRASDWRVTDDPTLIRRLLPLPKPETPEVSPADENTVLLQRIFPEKEDPLSGEAAKPLPEDLYVVQLLPLDRAQQRAIAERATVDDIDSFMLAIVRYGLDELAERPGDLLSLVAYWNKNHQFGSLVDMTEHAVASKLAEQDPFRPDNGSLSPEEARHGAERLAAALTFGHAFTLLATGDQPDATLAVGALDPRRVLPELKDDQRQALVRRGIFAPSTYGRLRFHHRTAQEYLAAKWLHRLLTTGCPLTRIWNLIFVERFGVRSVVPSLRSVAAWLALWVPEVRDELVRREPLALLIDGDPRSLPVATRETMLMAYAAKSKAGGVTPTYIEDRALWLFADPALVPALRESWALNDHGELRVDLLRCAREGHLVACRDLALGTAINPSRSDSERIVATEALAAFADTEALKSVAQSLREAPAPSLRLVTMTATELFPGALSVEDLVALLSRCTTDSDRDMSSNVQAILQSATGEQKRAFAHTVAAAAGGVCPEDGEDTTSAKRFNDLLHGFGALALEEISALPPGDPPAELVQWLGAMPPPSVSDQKERQAIFGAIGNHTELNRALFWKAVEAAYDGDYAPSFWYQLQLGRQSWFSFNQTDLEWLAGDIQSRARTTDQSLLLSAIVALLRSSGRFETEAAWLDMLAADLPHLREDLVRMRTPVPEDEEEPKWKVRQRQNEIKQQRQEAINKTAWIKFKDDLKGQAARLADANAAGEWTKSGHLLYQLALWLAEKHEGVAKSPLRWRDLEGAFGQDVAARFREGVCHLWRQVEPARPIYSAYNRLTTNYMNEMALGGLTLEATNPAWINSLSEADLRTAVRHGAYAEHQYPSWLDDLVIQRTSIVIPLLEQCLCEEWRRKWGRNELLARCARPSSDAPAPLVAKVLALTLGDRPKNLESLIRAVAIVGQARLDPQQRGALFGVARRRWKADLKTRNLDWASLHLALMFVADPDQAVLLFGTWLASRENTDKDRQSAFAVIFGRDGSVLPSAAWAALSVPVLEQLVRLAYTHLAEPPARRDGRVVTSASRGHDDSRSTLLNALLSRTGPDVFAALKRLGSEPPFAGSAHRFAELAHGLAESATERLAWSEGEVVAFERSQVAPVKSGADLLRIVVGILNDIQHSYSQADSSSAAALHRLTSEEELQHYLAEQLNLRADGRFKASRETQVSGKNKPDLIVTSHTAPVEVAIEIKHGAMPSWSTSVLRTTLRVQLAEQYLLPENRRHGVLVISHHGRRTWRNPNGGRVWSFSQLVGWLQELAAAVVRNRAGGVELRVVGLDPGIIPSKPERAKAA